MNEIQKTKVDRLSDLHDQITTNIRTTLTAAIEAGEILAEVKDELPHGAFTAWVETNAPFDLRTAQRYMKAHRNRERLKSDTVSSLTEAYRLIEEPAKASPASEPEADQVETRSDKAMFLMSNESALRWWRALNDARWQQYKAREEWSAEASAEMIKLHLRQMDLQAYHLVSLLKHVMTLEIEKGDYSRLENSAEVIRESSEHLAERAAYRKAQGWLNLDPDKLVNLNDEERPETTEEDRRIMVLLDY